MDFPFCASNAEIAEEDLQAQIVDEEWQKPQQIEESYCFPAAIARRQHEWSRQFPPTEKAGGGGSTPSLATIVLNNLAESRLALPVRSQSAIFRAGSGSVPGDDDGEELKDRIASRSVRFCLRRG